MLYLVGLGVLAFVGILLITALFLRTVVPTNTVHIVQSGKRTTIYGGGATTDGTTRPNVYYSWPSWLPKIGITVIKMPLANFAVSLKDYPGYDKGRVPFLIDVLAFFRVTNPEMAAQRISSLEDLQSQLHGVLQGACRSILAGQDIDHILEGRSTFGELFTNEVDKNLKEWGIQTVKCIEFMDIRDAPESEVIHNIMAKKQSLIEKESRVEVAVNLQAAQTAEIDAKQAVDIRAQDALQQVGLRTATQMQQVGIANEKAQQEIKSQAKVTKEREMEVTRVAQVRQAEINKDVQIVAAEQKRQTDVINAEAVKQVKIVEAEGQRTQTETIAAGNLTQAQLNAKGIEAEGAAKGAAEQALLMAPVNAQLTLAKEIGTNEGYQTYLVKVRTVEKDEAVGKAQAAALEKADVKVIANTGNSPTLDSVMDLFTPKGGTALAAAVEAFQQTPTGRKVIGRITGDGGKAA